MASYGQSEVPMADFFNQVRARAVATGRRLVPKRWRRDIAVVPVVRLTGVIGFSTRCGPDWPSPALPARSTARSACAMPRQWLC